MSATIKLCAMVLHSVDDFAETYDAEAFRMAVVAARDEYDAMHAHMKHCHSEQRMQEARKAGYELARKRLRESMVLSLDDAADFLEGYSGESPDEF